MSVVSHCVHILYIHTTTQYRYNVPHSPRIKQTLFPVVVVVVVVWLVGWLLFLLLVRGCWVWLWFFIIININFGRCRFFGFGNPQFSIHAWMDDSNLTHLALKKTQTNNKQQQQQPTTIKQQTTTTTTTNNNHSLIFRCLLFVV